jgi:hypothetical protein
MTVIQMSDRALTRLRVMTDLADGRLLPYPPRPHRPPQTRWKKRASPLKTEIRACSFAQIAF